MLGRPIRVHGELEALGMCPLWTSCGTGGGEGLTPLTLVEIGINLSSSGVEGWDSGEIAGGRGNVD